MGILGTRDRLGVDERPAVIFTTAYDEYALAAFDIHAVDYLLKPFADERLEEALERATSHLRGRRIDELRARLRGLLDAVAEDGPDRGEEHRAAMEFARPRYAERLAVPEREGVTLVDVDDVMWIEADGDYARLHADGRSHLLRTTMTALERRLDPDAFLRIHRSTIVRIDGIRRLRSDAHGDYVAVLEEGREVRVGRTYRDAVFRRLGLER